jgi:outer membrane protein W
MNYRLFSAVTIIVVIIIFTESAPSLADDTFRHLTLGHDRFTLATQDPKVPMPSVIYAKYGFGGENGFRSYLGTGLAYTLLPEVKPTDSLKLRTGVAAQAGASYHLGGTLSLTLDYKYLYITPEAQHGDAQPPQSIGIGVNIKF